jgi:hypothetical protein
LNVVIDHDDRGAGDDPRRDLDAVGDRVPSGQASVVRLLDPGHDEHVVVHGEAEEDHEREQRDPGLDGADIAASHEIRPPAVLEDRDHHTERRGHRQHVEQDRDPGDDDGPERDQHEQEGQDQDEQDHRDDGALELGVEVLREGELAPDVGLGAGHLAQGRGHDVVAQRLQRSNRRPVRSRARQGHGDLHDARVGIDVDDERLLHQAGRQGLRPELVDGCADAC